VKVSTSSEESTMEELQSAIQAAIAHCKNSIAVAKE
jgi:BRI1 kinase inhibitor 1